MSVIFLCIILLSLTLASGVFSASETSLFSLSPMKIRGYQSSPDPRKRLIARLVLSPRDLLVTIMMFNVMVNIMAQNVASDLFGSVSSWWLRVGVPLGLTLFFGEVIPKSLALPNNVRIAHFITPFISFLKTVTHPLRTRITTLTSWLARVMFFFLKREKELSLEELKHVLGRSLGEGALSQDEQRLIQGFLELRDSNAREVMRPRQEVIYYNTQQPLSELYALMSKQKVTRIPVCDGDLQNMLGILTARTLLLYRHNIKKPEDLQQILRKPFFVPESVTAQHLFQQMTEKNTQFAVVVDEYGSISGVLTREDIVEEVVGPIQDQRDSGSSYTATGENVIIASGKLELSEFEEIFSEELESDTNMVTLGGWLTEQMGHIPQTGEHYTTQNFLFHILASDPNRVRRVYIRQLKQQEDVRQEND